MSTSTDGSGYTLPKANQWVRRTEPVFSFGLLVLGPISTCWLAGSSVLRGYSLTYLNPARQVSRLVMPLPLYSFLTKTDDGVRLTEL